MSVAPNQIAFSGPTTLTAALSKASRATGVDFDYLLTTAKRESGLDSAAKSKTSSATGLFQFLDQTWLGTVKKHGTKHGLGHLSAVIEQTSSGRFKVADSARRSEILALRKDPTTSALMAGEMTKDSQSILEKRLGREVTGSELYMAHFLGPRGAADFLEAESKDPTAIAATKFPTAAGSNRSVFYKGNGTPRSLSGVKAHLTHLHNGASIPASTEIPTQQTLTGGGHGQIGLAAGRGFGGAAALRLTPEVVQILSSLDPLSGDKGGKNSNPFGTLRQPRGLYPQ